MSRGIGHFLLNVSVAAYLFATGVTGVIFSGGEIRQAVNSVIKGDIADIIVIIIAIFAILAGVFVLLRLFGFFLPITELFLTVLAIVWVVFIAMFDVLYPLNSRNIAFVQWLKDLGSHLMVLSGILLSMRRFGTR